MLVLLIIVWLLAGLIAVWREYHGMLKSWYDSYEESYWDFDKESGFSAIRLLLYISPIMILGGLFSLSLCELTPNTCWWFTTKNK